VQHLATLRRIVSLTSLGVSLTEVQRALNDSGVEMDLLDRIDQHKAHEIERLTAVRRTIAEFKSGDSTPTSAHNPFPSEL
jgi:DNA-binding transcriptional MerR regulator